MKIDKKNGSIAYNDNDHVYWNVDDNEKYISVTTLIHKFTQPFDSDFWSSYKALQKLLDNTSWSLEKSRILKTKKLDLDNLLYTYNISKESFDSAKESILDEWDKTNKEACERGTKIHAEMENSMYKMKDSVSLKKFGVGGKFVCDKGRVSLDLENGVYPEYLISRTSDDGILRIAGQIDLLIKKGNEISILDFKTNKEIKQSGGFNVNTRTTSKMLYPLNKLDDCNYMHYTMQLSTYAWMVQQLNPDFIIKDLILVHFDHNDNQTIYHLDYLKNEVESMLKYHKREKHKEKELSKLKRIEY